MTASDPIDDAIRRLQSTGGPVVVRLVGPGAWNAASRWSAVQGVRESVPFPFLPDTPEGALWLHDDPGSRYVADIVAAWCAIEGSSSWVLLLTGPAIDAAHPTHGETLSVPEEGTAAPGHPTSVQLEIPDDPLGTLARLADEGGPARAHALYEHLVRTDPEAAAPWCWLELLRLIQVGRSDEVDALGPRLPGRDACRAKVLLTMAEASLDRSRRDLSRVYLDALEAGEHSESDASDAALFRALLDRDLDGLRTLEPGSTRHQILLRKIRRSLGDAVPDAVPPGDFAEVMEVFEDEPVSGFLAVGDLLHAVVLARRRVDVAGEYLRDDGLDDALHIAKRALAAGEVDEAASAIEPFEASVGSAHTPKVFLWLLYAARVASHRGRVGELVSYQARLGALGPATWAPAKLVGELVPPPGEGADAWCEAVYLHILETCSREPCEALERAFESQSPLPIAIGPYALERVLATGGMGTVWEGRHRLTGRAVAVKVLEETTPESVQLFRGEVNVIARFDHPMIVSVLDLLEVGARVEQQSQGALRQGQPALVMELVSNGTLADHVGELEWSDIQAALIGVLEGLAYAHAHGVVHQDLKPQNILVGEGGSLRLADFGLARLDDSKVAGTPAYMAPEQFRRGRVGPAADVYAVACIGWTLACGLPPFVGPAKQLAVAHASAALPAFEPITPVPDAFEIWLERCLRKDPSSRFPSAAAAAEALLAIESAPSGLPGSAPVPPFAARGSSTFVLQTLLDLPDHLFENPEEATATRRLHDIFEDRASWRPRIPTERLLHKGDPPILFQREAQKELWTVLMGALSTRTQRVSLHGRGGDAILHWLRRRARISGLLVHEQPVHGKVCIVDVSERDPSALSSARGERWVLVWRDQEVSGARRITLRPFHTGAIFWMVYSRILLHPQTACEVATQAVGSPMVAFALVDDWLEDPGVEMTEKGLQLLRPPDVGAPRAMQRWRNAVSRARPERLRLARFMAIKPFAADGAFLERICGAGQQLDSLAMEANGAWKMPRDLQAVVLEGIDVAERRELHALSAAHERQPAARALHRVMADPSRENTLAMIEILRDVRADLPVLETIQFYVNLHLLEARETRTRWNVAQLSDNQLTGRVWDTDPLVADLARLELFERMLPWPEGLMERIEAELFEPRRPPLSIRLAHALSGRLRRYGRADHALALFDRLASHLEGRPGNLPALLGWARGRCLDGEDAIRHFEHVLEGAGVEIAPTLHIDLSDELLAVGRFEEALEHTVRSRGTWSIASDYNRGLALLALERDREASELMGRLTTLAMGTASPSLYVGLCYAELLLNLDEPTPMWEALLDLCGPIRDPVMREVLVRRLDSLPRTQRIDTMLRAMQLG